MLILKRFEKEDWYGWAGATSFPGGDKPLISHDLKVDGHDAVLIVSGEEPGFLEIDIFPPDAPGKDEPEDGLPVYHCTGAQALNALHILLSTSPDTLTTEYLIHSLKFERIDK